MKGLIGYTGFVGGNIYSQGNFDKVYNSKNICEIRNQEFDLLICAGISAVKWKANKNPQDDLNEINKLLEDIKDVKVKKFILISTVDVYKEPNGVDENTLIDKSDLEPYGLNRLYVEEYVKQHFDDYLIIRLPGLFGAGLKKNFIYDMIHNNCLELTHYKSVFQFYDLANIWADINIALKNNIKILNITAQPVSVEAIAKECFGVDFRNDNGKEPVYYNMMSIYDDVYGGRDGYLYSEEQVYEGLKKYLNKFGR